MANLRKWSTTATGNASVAGGANTINFAEGQTPGSVNNSAREMMAQVRSIYTPAEWGWVEHSATASVASQTAFKLAGNQTTNWTAGRRWRLKSGSTTRYGAVVSSSFTAETTITVTVDSGSLSASHSLAALAAIDSNHVPGLSTYLTSASAATAYARLAGTNTFTANQIIEVTDNTNAALRVTQLGSGNALLIEDSANPDSSPVVVTAAGDVGIGTTGSLNGKLVVSDAGASGLEILPNYPGGGAGTSILSYNRSGAAYINSAIDGLSHTFRTSGVDKFKIDSSGNALIIGAGGLGYGTGSGGTVTQITSKSTGVTLNKTNGQIVTHNASLSGAGASVSFVVTNSTVAATDTVIVHRASGGTAGAYIANVDAVAAGSFTVSLRNFSGGALSEALTLNFAVIKAVTS